MSERPRLKVTRLGRKKGVDIVCARTSKSPNLTMLGGLIVPPDAVVVVRMLRYRRIFRTVIFAVAEGGTAAELKAGEEYTYVSAHELRSVETVLSPALAWRETVFQPADGVEMSWGEYRTMRRVTENLNLEALPLEAKIVKGAWDHEHCVICNTCICDIHGPEAAVSNKNDWVCKKCYAEYVVSKNIDFHYWPEESDEEDPA